MEKTKKILIGISIAAATLSGTVMNAYAEEYSIRGNGAGSDSTIETTRENSVTIEQENNTTMDNNLSIDANSGNNSEDQNTGGNNGIDSGNIQIQTQINNSANTNVVSSNCCPTSGSTGGSGSQVVISNNGAGSSNNVSYNATNNTEIIQYNDASIINYVQGYANTGGNTARENTHGDVAIDTGNISVFERIFNTANLNKVSLAKAGSGQDFMALIFGNGAFSSNEIDVENDQNLVIAQNNDADVENVSIWDLITGNNSADENTKGDVAITTGDIRVDTKIVNDVNKNVVDITCCEKEKEEKEKEKPVAVAQAKTEAPKPQEKEQGVAPSKGEVQAAMAEMLPATGNNWLFFALIGNVMMLLLGTILRLRSGRSPGITIA